MAVGSVAEGGAQGEPSARAAISKLGLSNVRGVITSPVETWTGLDGLCTELGLPLLLISLAGETPLGLEAFEALHPLGGHILLTSGTTGSHKMVLISPAADATSPAARRRNDRPESGHRAQCVRFSSLDRNWLQVPGQRLDSRWRHRL